MPTPRTDASPEIFDLLNVPVTDWAKAAMLQTFGARPDEDDDDDSATWVTVPGGRGYLRYRHPGDESRGAPEVVALTVSLDGWTYADALAEVVARCGRPVMMGGDGPWLRWLTSDTRLVVLDCLSDGEPLLHLEHAEWSAEDEYRSFNWGEIDGAPYQWWVELGTLPDGTSLPGGFEVESLDEFETQLGEICESLAHAATILPDDYLRAVNLTVLRTEHRDDWVQFYATGRGLFANVRQSWQELPQGKAEVERLVTTLVEEIRRWGVEPADLAGGGYVTLGLSAAPIRIDFTTLGIDDDA